MNSRPGRCWVIPDVLLNAAFQSTAIVTSGSTHQFQLVPHGFPSPNKPWVTYFNMVSPWVSPWFPISKQLGSQRIKLTSFRAQHLASERKRLSSSARVMSWCADDMMEIGDRFLQKIQQKSQCSEIVPSKRRQCPASPWILVVFTKPCPTKQPPKHRSLWECISTLPARESQRASAEWCVRFSRIGWNNDETMMKQSPIKIMMIMG